MNIQRVFQAVKEEPDQATLVVVAIELENQGYHVLVDGKLEGSHALIEADANDQLDVPLNTGTVIEIEKDGEKQVFRVYMLDVDAICLTDLGSPPMIHSLQHAD